MNNIRPAVLTSLVLAGLLSIGVRAAQQTPAGGRGAASLGGAPSIDNRVATPGSCSSRRG